MADLESVADTRFGFCPFTSGHPELTDQLDFSSGDDVNV